MANSQSRLAENDTQNPVGNNGGQQNNLSEPNNTDNGRQQSNARVPNNTNNGRKQNFILPVLKYRNTRGLQGNIVPVLNYRNIGGLRGLQDNTLLMLHYDIGDRQHNRCRQHNRGRQQIRCRQHHSPCLVIHKDFGGGLQDIIVIDKTPEYQPQVRVGQVEIQMEIDNNGGQENNVPVLTITNNESQANIMLLGLNNRNIDGLLNNPPEANGGEPRMRIRREDIEEMIERILRKHLNRDQVVEALRVVRRFELRFAIIVRNQLQWDNCECFRVFWRLKALSCQRSNSNQLLEQHANEEERRQRASGVSQAESSTSNSSNGNMPREPPYVRTNGNSSDDQGNPETVGNIIQSNGDNSASVDTPEGPSNGMMRSIDENLHSTDGC